MKKITLWDYFRYRFDNTMSRGTIAIIVWLFIISAIMILTFSLFVVIARILPVSSPAESVSIPEVIWSSMMHALDPGTVAGDDGPWLFRLSMFGITMGGIFVVSILIGVITSGIEDRLDELRKGRSFVVENGHTVILGWSPQVFFIISELVIANENQKNSCIVILAEEDKIEMEDAIRDKVGRTGRTRIVCRTGNPIDLTDLNIVNPHAARAIIIPAPEMEDPDSHVIKTILAITNNPNRHAEPYHIVAEIRNQKNMGAAQLVAQGEAQLILADDLISRITVQTSLQAGLSTIYTELLDFSGDEMYFHSEPALAGKTFGEALLAYEDSIIVGVRMGDGQILLNPPMDTVITAEAQLIAITEDDDTVHLSGRGDYQLDEQTICSASGKAPTPINVLLIGWNRRATIIINELDNYVAPGSRVTVFAQASGANSQLKASRKGHKNLTAQFIKGDTTNRNTLDKLDIPSYEHVIILSYSDLLKTQDADARTLITLLHLRDIAQQSSKKFSIVSEMMDIQNRDLAQVTQADDFIVSEKLVSLMLAQVSENAELLAVFEDLFDPDGSEIYLKPVHDYVRPGQAVNFYTVVESARRQDQVALGYRLLAEANNPASDYGVRLNPKKSEKITFSAGDRIIVLAED